MLTRRPVPFCLPGEPSLHVSVLEISDRKWWTQQSQRSDSNPFGAKLWPAALGIAEHLASLPTSGWEHVDSALDCCCGNGLVSMALASRGVGTVTASDISPLALELTSQAAALQDLNVATLHFDLGCPAPLPDAELVVFADLFYDEALGRLVAKRVAEATKRGSWVIVGSHVRSGREAYLKRLGQLLGDEGAMPAFKDTRIVRSTELRWKEKRCSLMEFNTPTWVHEGYAMYADGQRRKQGKYVSKLTDKQHISARSRA